MGRLKNKPGHDRKRTHDVSNASPMLGQLRDKCKSKIIMLETHTHLINSFQIVISLQLIKQHEMIILHLSWT